MNPADTHSWYLGPGAAVPRGCGHTRTPVTGLHLCRLVSHAVSSSSTLLDPASGQAHHLPLLHAGATLGRALRAREADRPELGPSPATAGRAPVPLTALDQLVKYQLVTHGPMLHSSLPWGRALELHSTSLTTLPWSVMQRTLLVLLPIPQSTEHYEHTKSHRTLVDLYVSPHTQPSENLEPAPAPPL